MLSNQLNLECALCSEMKNPRLLDCLHSFCLECLQTLFTTKQNLVCPTCYYENKTQLDELPFDFVRTNARSQINDGHKENERPLNSDDASIKHPNAEEDLIITSHPECEVHERTHKRSYDEFIGKAQQNGEEIMCIEHPMKVADIYCDTPNCSKLICSSCVTGIHKVHNFFSIPDTLNNLRTTVIITKNRIEEFEKTMNTLIQIRDDQVNPQIECLVGERIISDQLNELRSTCNLLRMAIEFSDEALHNSSDIQLLYLKKLLDNRIQSLNHNNPLSNTQFNIGKMYEKGKGVSQSYDKAMEWYLKAADQGHPDALFDIGKMYSNGEGVPQSHEEAMDWYQKAANQGHSGAQYNIGFMYSNGEGVAQSNEKAMAWYLKAANQGDADAQYNIGTIHSNGEGVPQSYLEAMEWYLKAANQGHAYAQCKLGKMYEYGKGATRSNKGAMKWYLKAANQGHDKAKRKFKLLDEK